MFYSHEDIFSSVLLRDFRCRDKIVHMLISSAIGAGQEIREDREGARQIPGRKSAGRMRLGNAMPYPLAPMPI